MALETVRVKKKDGTYRSVKMPRAQAQALRKKFASKGGGRGPTPKPKPATSPTQPRTQRLPSVYEGTGADYKSVNDAVMSQIQGMNAPLRDQQAQVREQTTQNINTANSYGNEAMGSILGLMMDAQRGTGSSLATASQMAANSQMAENDSAQFLAHAMGPAFNAQVGQLVGREYGLDSANQNAASVQNLWDVANRGDAQRDFFQRAGAVAAVTQQSFNNAQRAQQQSALNQLARQVAANQSQAPALRRQYMQEDATFGLQRQNALMEQQAAMQAGLLDQAKWEAGLQQQDFENQLAIDRLGISQQNAATSLLRAQQSAANSAANQGLKLSKERRDQIQKVLEDVRKMQARVGSVEKRYNPQTGEIEDAANTSSDVFKGTKGPWREAFRRLTASVGLSPNVAAVIASQNWEESITRSTPMKIRKMLTSRGVSPKVQKQIINKYFGPNGWKYSHPKRAQDAANNIGGAFNNIVGAFNNPPSDPTTGFSGTSYQAPIPGSYGVPVYAN